jgi:hypothetical protein
MTEVAAVVVVAVAAAVVAPAVGVVLRMVADVAAAIAVLALTTLVEPPTRTSLILRIVAGFTHRVMAPTKTPPI